MSLFEMAATACSAAESGFCAFRICAGCLCPLWVKNGKAQTEQMLSGLAHVVRFTRADSTGQRNTF
jgi:hypothetical protein